MQTPPVKAFLQQVSLGWALLVLTTGWAVRAGAQSPPGTASPGQNRASETTEDYNRRLSQLQQMVAGHTGRLPGDDYRIGPEDLLNISVFEAADLGHTVRVSAGGEISLPLLGSIRAAGLTPHTLESVLEELLRHTYMKDPHVSVFVQEIQSHPVSVFGAVKQPGVFQVRGAKTLVEMLSMAQGLAEDAGDTVLVMHQTQPDVAPPGIAVQGEAPAGAASEGDRPVKAAPVAQTPVAEGSPPVGNAVEINLKSLLESGDPRSNVLVYPGDVVKVTRAGIVYVIGEVRKPGGFQLKSNENISVLQALALAEGLTRTSAKSHARIIHTDEATGKRTELALNLDKILAGKIADPLLQPKDIVFVPNSAGRSAVYRGLEAAISVGTGVAVYRR
jgi:polysaccharide export outer membrane protein